MALVEPRASPDTVALQFDLLDVDASERLSIAEFLQLPNVLRFKVEGEEPEDADGASAAGGGGGEVHSESSDAFARARPGGRRGCSTSLCLRCCTLPCAQASASRSGGGGFCSSARLATVLQVRAARRAKCYPHDIAA